MVNHLEKQIQQMDESERKQTITRIQKLYAEELPTITLYYPKWYWVHDGTVKFFYSLGGLAAGIPSLLNKCSFL